MANDLGTPSSIEDILSREVLYRVSSYPVICVACDTCGAQFYRKRKCVLTVFNRSGKWTCKSCTNVLKNKSKSRPIGSVRVKKQGGYIQQKTENGWIFQHRIIGIPDENLRQWPMFIVHHKNGDITDNRPENLEMMTNGEHTTLHTTGRVVSEKTRELIRHKAIMRSLRRQASA